jgi:hypothetical protein
MKWRRKLLKKRRARARKFVTGSPEWRNFLGLKPVVVENQNNVPSRH